MRFASPWWLVLVPLVVGHLWLRYRPGVTPAVLYSSLDNLRSLPRTLAQRVKRLLPLLEGAALLLLVVAMARPQAGREDSLITSQGIALQIVVDRSGSMAEGDLDPDPMDRKLVTRLDVVKDVVKDFVDEGGELPGRPNDMVGLISFAGFVQVHCPVTLDHPAFLQLVNGLHLPGRLADRESRMTAMGDALVTAVDRIKDVPAKSRVVILLSDGDSNIGEASPRSGAEVAKEFGVKVYTVGIGTRFAGLDEDTMKEVARITGARYFNTRSADGLTRIYKEIDALERVELPPMRFTRWRELYLPLLAAGAALLLAHRLLLDTRFRSLP